MSALTKSDVLLLVIAANGGTMTKADALAAAEKVWALSPAEREYWRRLIAPAVRYYAAHRTPQ